MKKAVILKSGGGNGEFANQQRALESLDVHWGYSVVPVIENTVIECHFFIVVVLRQTKVPLQSRILLWKCNHNCLGRVATIGLLPLIASF